MTSLFGALDIHLVTEILASDIVRSRGFRRSEFNKRFCRYCDPDEYGDFGRRDRPVRNPRNFSWSVT
ncbi:MAG: hypothetical protein IPJ07_14605 [Acidobacteria bacterium]|nr:hypothetical protein [Acidobacteriota bacterium]